MPNQPATARDPRVTLSKRRWIERYGGQKVLDAEGMDVVPCIDCDDSICHGWRVQKPQVFVPSQVDLSSMFVGTFDHLEAENTAAVIVKVLALNGDTWRSAKFSELAEGFGELTKDDGPWRRRFNNPFVRVDMHDLVNRGFAAWDGDTGIQFTPIGLLRMCKWVNSGGPDAAH